MNKKHMSLLITFGFAVLCTLLVLIKGFTVNTVACIAYNAAACFSALIWGGAVTVAKIRSEQVQGFLWHCILWFALAESLITLAL